MCRTAGIRVVVVTGDNRATAEAVCRDIGALSPQGGVGGSSSSNSKYVSLTGAEWDALSPAQREEAAAGLVVFSRVEPHHKTALVEALRRNGAVVGMTGDGVNDAPALRRWVTYNFYSFFLIFRGVKG